MGRFRLLAWLPIAEFDHDLDIQRNLNSPKKKSIPFLLIRAVSPNCRNSFPGLFSEKNNNKFEEKYLHYLLSCCFLHFPSICVQRLAPLADANSQVCCSVTCYQQHSHWLIRMPWMYDVRISSKIIFLYRYKFNNFLDTSSHHPFSLGVKWSV